MVDVNISSKPQDFPTQHLAAARLLSELKALYRKRAINIMSRYSRGSVLVQLGFVITRDELDDHFGRQQ